MRRSKGSKVGAGNLAIPVNSVAPVLSGTTTSGSTLSLTTGTWSNTPTGYVYTFKRSGELIQTGATNTYVLTSADVGKSITGYVQASNALGSGSTVASNTLGPITLSSTTITTPVLTRTSAAGASPLVWTTNLNYNDTAAGNLLRVQTAANLTGDFTTTTQDIPHLLTESEITSSDIDLSVDNPPFATPSGAYSLRCRVERDDGVMSNWSNVLTDTISASVARMTSAAGGKRNGSLILSNGDYTVTGNNTGGNCLDGATIAGATKGQFEVTVGTMTGTPDPVLIIGMYNAAARNDFNVNGTAPGWQDSNGFTIMMGYGTTGVAFKMSSDAISDGYNFPAALTVGDVITIKYDRSGAAGTHSVHVYRNNVLVPGWSETNRTFTNFDTAFICIRDKGSYTFNFGGSAFTHALDPGYTFYG